MNEIILGKEFTTNMIMIKNTILKGIVKKVVTKNIMKNLREKKNEIMKHYLK
jgi:hypothetical protein